MKKIVMLVLLTGFISVMLFPAKLNVNAEAGGNNTVNHTLRTEVVTIVNNTTNLFTPISSVTDEDFRPSSRKWNGMPTVIKAGNNIFVAWQTGGVREPDPDKLNYITVAVSSDGGITWIDPFIIVQPIEEERQAMVPMFYYNRAGQLYLLFSYEGFGIHAIAIHNADGNLEDITYDPPFFINSFNSSFTKPTLLSDGRIMYASGTVDTRIFTSNDDGLKFNLISETESEAPVNFRRFSESVIVEKSDGILWHLRRLENAANGGIEQSFSADGGLSWTVAQGNLPEPLRSPGSRFNMGRLQSGALLFITNAAGMGGINRTRMTAYLSEDDGESWPYSILLDPAMSSYPDFHQDKDGTIYIAFDKDRFGEGGIRLCIVTEQDIKAGQYISDKAQQLLVVTKMNYNYADIKSVNGAFPKIACFNTGIELKELLANYKTVITVTDENGVNHEITGTYRVSGYNKDVAGTYNAYFLTDLPETLKDSFSLLEFKIVLEDKKGCFGSVNTGLVFIALFGAGGFFAFANTRKKKNINS